MKNKKMRIFILILKGVMVKRSVKTFIIKTPINIKIKNISNIASMVRKNIITIHNAMNRVIFSDISIYMSPIYPIFLIRFR